MYLRIPPRRSPASMQYPFTITSSLALAVRASPQMKPRQLHCTRVLRGVASRPVTATTLYLLTRVDIVSLSHDPPSHSQACPVSVMSSREALGLANANSATAITDLSALRAPRSFSLVFLVHLPSSLILSIVSGTLSTAWIVRSATSSARVSGYAPILRFCFRR